MAITQIPQKTLPEAERQVKGLSRRNFFKYSLASGVGVGAAVMGAGKLIPSVGTPAEAAPKMGIEHDSMPIEITKDYKRMNQKNTIFGRFGWDEKIKPLGREFGGKFHEIIVNFFKYIFAVIDEIHFIYTDYYMWNLQK